VKQVASRFVRVGFDRFIRLDWLDQVARLVSIGASRSDIVAALDADLRAAFPTAGEGSRNAREKVLTVLLCTWAIVPPDLAGFRDDGLTMLDRVESSGTLALHWGMLLAAYPFFGAVAATAGSLLRLQGNFSAGQLQRRMRERYGERETVVRASRRVLQSMADWGALAETSAHGVYTDTPRRTITDAALGPWLIEAALRAEERSASSLATLIRTPLLFPLDLNGLAVGRLAASQRLEIVRQSLDDDLVLLPR
jgi:hypothetical protein